MWTIRGIKRPPEEDDTQRNTEGYEIRTPRPRGMAITDWAKAWKILEAEPEEKACREWICGSDQWAIWRYRKNDRNSNGELENARPNERSTK